MKSVPGRDTRPAYSRERRTWYGYGTLTRTEKSGFGRFLHDATYVFGDVSTLGLPLLAYVAATDPPGGYGVTASVLVAWMTMWFVGTAVRGGWIRPLLTNTLGWVSLRPALLVTRLAYYNLTLALAGYGSVAAASGLGWPPASLVIASLVGALAALAFPRLAESLARRLDG